MIICGIFIIMKEQLKIMKMIRKSALPQNRVERPAKGCGYRRPQNRRDLTDE
jgi:hypothetical protein